MTTAVREELVLRPLQVSDLPTLETWFTDTELARRLGGMLPLADYLAYVQREPNYFAWIAWEEQTLIGAALLEITLDGTAAFSFLVAPDRRSRGYGRRILDLLLSRPEGSTANKWLAEVEADNVASQRCLATMGFITEHDVPDADGFLHYTRPIPDSLLARE